MDEWRVICTVGDIAPGAMKRVEPTGLPPLVVFNVDGAFFVTVDQCTHAQACLSEGTLHGDVIECPFHGGKFDVRTGKAVARPAKKALQVFEVDVRGEDVVMRVPRMTRRA